MKRITIISLFCPYILFVSCDVSPKKDPKYSPETTATDSVINSGGNITDTNFRKGARLIASNDCFTCHRIEQKNIGPSYREIAARYRFNEGNVENLSHSIMYGAKGLWGDKAMTAHSNVEKRAAVEMARYILSLDTTTNKK